MSNSVFPCISCIYVIIHFFGMVSFTYYSQSFCEFLRIATHNTEQYFFSISALGNWYSSFHHLLILCFILYLTLSTCQSSTLSSLSPLFPLDLPLVWPHFSFHPLPFPSLLFLLHRLSILFLVLFFFNNSLFPFLVAFFLALLLILYLHSPCSPHSLSSDKPLLSPIF